MSCSNGIVIWTFLLIMTGAVVRGEAGPNAVALINGQTSLDCVSNLLAASQWSRTTDGTSNPLQIASGCSVVGNNSAYYRTEQPGGNICRLIIANATMQQAGVYTCFDGASTSFRSLVTIIDPNANISAHKQSEVVEGDQLNISCSINYNGPASPAPSLHPSPYWTTSPGQTFTSGTFHPSTTVVTLVATLTVQKPTVPIFQCNAVFEITGTTSGYNSTFPPDNLTLGTTTQIDVQSVPPTTSPTTTLSTTTTTESSSLAWIVVPVYFGVSLVLVFVCFPIHYMFSKRKDTYNTRFPFLKQMLPCLDNDGIPNAPVVNLGWPILYVVMKKYIAVMLPILLVGFIAIPVMFFIVQCSKTATKVYPKEAEQEVPGDSSSNLMVDDDDSSTELKPNTNSPAKSKVKKQVRF